ncbi:MAG: (Na+)-NQR maturation NqrM [Gammaproteobacteria bacterium]
MAYFLVTFVVMLVVILIMAVGVIFGRSAIKGSCGGANNGNCVCTEKCDKRKKMEAQSNGGSA